MDAVLRDRWLAHARRRMSGAGLRAGAARAQVVAFMAEEGQCLVGAQEIVDGLRERGGVGAQASVYRVLDELHGLGLVRRSLDDQGAARYEIHDEDHHHHHFVDDATGAVTAFADPELERALADAAARLGVELSGHDIVLRGRRTGGR